MIVVPFEALITNCPRHSATALEDNGMRVHSQESLQMFLSSQAVWEVGRISSAGPSRHSFCSTGYRDIMREVSNVDGYK